MTGLLELTDVSRSFGRVQAISSVSMSVAPDEIRGLIGPNGAGKTTLVNVVSGFMPLSAGTIVFDGERLDRMAPHARVRHGVGRTFQTPQLCGHMPVIDNIVVGAHQRLTTARIRNAFSRTSLPQLRREATERAEEVGLKGLLRTPAGALSYGHMRLLEIARALMGGPRLLLLDEPVAGMNESESYDVAEIVRALPGRGTAVLVIEHDMPFVMNLCDRITVLDHGIVIAEGTPAEVQSDARVEQVYLGTGGEEE